MSDVFVIRNQLQQFWGKKKAWVDGHKPRKILVCKHEDEGINLLVELSSKDVDLRGEVFAISLNEKGVPQVEPSQHRIVDEEDLELPAEDPTLFPDTATGTESPEMGDEASQTGTESPDESSVVDKDETKVVSDTTV